jgi:ATP-dependent helicase/nuclease subunit B
LYILFELIFKAQLSIKENKYYTKDYLKVLRHPFVKNLQLSFHSDVTRALIHTIEDILTGKEKMDISGSVFIQLKDIENFKGVYDTAARALKKMGINATPKELQDLLKQIHQRLFEGWQEVKNFYEFSICLEEFLELMIDKSFLRNYRFNLNIAARIYDIKDELQNVSFNKKILSREDIFKIFESKLSREIIAFSGSPLTGLQILGLLETRSLNFENVIVLDVNEGTLPKLSIYEPLIPREVMISLNLDRLELEEEIQRYQFMRLISSAKNVHLVYQQSKDKERSRFVEELIWEKQKKVFRASSENSKHSPLSQRGGRGDLERLNLRDIVPVRKASFEVQVSSNIKTVKKTPQIINFLKNRSYSASSVNTYLRNPLEFYYYYVLGLREKDDLLDEPEARQVGTFIHEFLEEQFRPLLNKPFAIDTLFHHAFFNNFDNKFEEVFSKGMKADSFLLKSVLKERLIRFLDKEQSHDERQVEKILYLEQSFEDSISLPTAEVRFKYIIDRIDKMRDGTIMIIDYKTGSLDVMPGKINTIASMELSRESIRDHVRSFQIPLYFYYLDKKYKDQPINATTYNLRTLDIRRFIDKKNTDDREHINSAFTRALDFIMNEILDPNIDFIEDVSGVY